MRAPFLFVFLCVSFLYADEESPLLSEGAKKTMVQEGKIASNGVMKELSMGQKGVLSQEGTRDVMIIDPKTIANDWVDAFRLLSNKKGSDITFVLRDQSILSNVTDIDTLPGGCLMLLTLKTVQGPKYQIVKTSDLQTVLTK